MWAVGTRGFGEHKEYTYDVKCVGECYWGGVRGGSSPGVEKCTNLIKTWDNFIEFSQSRRLRTPESVNDTRRRPITHKHHRL